MLLNSLGGKPGPGGLNKASSNEFSAFCQQELYRERLTELSLTAQSPCILKGN